GSFSIETATASQGTVGILGDLTLVDVNLSALDIGAEVTVTIVVVAGNNQSTVAQVRAAEFDPVRTNNSMKLETTVQPLACVTLTGSAPHSAGAVAWLAGDGDARDIVAGNNGVLHNGAGFAIGWSGQAFSFNGSTGGNGYVEVPDNPNLNLQTLTLEGWIKAS